MKRLLIITLAVIILSTLCPIAQAITLEAWKANGDVVVKDFQKNHIGLIRSGEIVYVIQETKDWISILYDDQRVGYCYKPYFSRLGQTKTIDVEIQADNFEEFENVTEAAAEENELFEYPILCLSGLLIFLVFILYEIRRSEAKF